MEALCAPASEALIVAWLWPIADAVEYTPAEDEFFRRAHAVWMAADTVPHVAWTLSVQREGMRTWKRMPSAAAVIDLVYPRVRPLVARVRALRRIVSLQG